MNQLTKEKVKKDKFVSHVKEMMLNRGVESDEEWWASRENDEKLRKLINGSEPDMILSAELGIECEEMFIFAAFHDNKTDDKQVEEIVKTCNTSMAKMGEAVNVIFMVENMEERISIEKKFKGKISQKLHLFYILINDYEGETIKLKHVDRFELLQMPPLKAFVNMEDEIPGKQDETQSMTGYVMTVDLRQLVEIYNLVGDDLFKNNVRYGISEQLSVDGAIRDTLENAPEKFWFRNNGIAIVVERPDFKLDRVGEILLDKPEQFGKLAFSVVNGAQTISVASEYYYNLKNNLQNEKSSEAKEKLEKFEKAKVLVRIIHAVNDKKNKEDVRNEVNEISVALNRQKPIKIEDIAYTMPFVERLAQYLEKKRGEDYFRIVKRGEWYTGNCMSLVEFARARKACMGKPGEARSSGANKLLDLDIREKKFRDKDIFVPEWMSCSEEEMDRVFDESYKNVYFAHCLAKCYSGVQSKKQENDVKKIILNNGKWYFVAYTIRQLQEKKVTRTEYLENNGKAASGLQDKVNFFVERVCNVVSGREEYKDLNSNHFKSEKLFQDICNEGEQKSRANVGETGGIPTRAKVKRVRFNSNEKSVKDTSEAMVETVKYLAQTYPDLDSRIGDNCKVWLSKYREKTSYFKDVKDYIEVGEKIYWVGTYSNNETKLRQIKEVCADLNVPKNSIVWYVDGVDTPVFKW